MYPAKAKWIFLILGAVGFLSVLLVVVHILFLPVGLTLMAAAIAVNLLFYRCPSCKKHLGRTTGDYCPHCGSRIAH